MFALSFAQLRANISRLVATVLAIVIAVGFVVATLVLSETSKQTVLKAVGAQYSVTDVVVKSDLTSTAEGDISLEARPELLEQVRAIPGVAAATLDGVGFVQTRLPGRNSFQPTLVNDVTVEKQLQWETLTAGRLPTRAGEVAMRDGNGISVGSVVAVRPMRQPTAADTEGGAGRRPVSELETVTVVGLIDLSGALRGGTEQLFSVPAQAAAWGGSIPEAIRVAGQPGTDDRELADQIRDGLAAAGQRDLLIRTGEQEAESIAEAYTGDAAQLTMVLLVFGTLAVLVCGLVIANTFSVLLVQRTQELAMLRCVGATSKQLRRSVLIESALISTIASGVGVGAGVALASLVGVVANALDSPIPLSGVSIPPSAIGIGMAVGIVVTVISAFAPARRATRVAPLAALRPIDPAPARSRDGRRRRAIALLLLLPSAALLGFAAQRGQLGLGLVGGVVSFLALLLLAQWLVPPTVSVIGRLLGPIGQVPGRLAAANSTRNPQRTAATATALIIGVTLTTAMVVGAASTRATTSERLDRAFPTDLSIVAGSKPLPVTLEGALTRVPDVQAVTALTRATVRLDGASDTEYQVLGIDPVPAARAVRSSTGAGLPEPGAVNVPVTLVEQWGGEGSSVRMIVGSRSLDLRVNVVAAGAPLAVTQADLNQLDPQAQISQIWIRLLDNLDADTRSAALDTATNTAAELAPDSTYLNSSEQRDTFDQVINLLLLIVTALLAVAVLIALIGVGNTIALSVVERRQESGLLRALGLTQTQLRWMLLWEAALIAIVAATIGLLVGTVYGALGTAAALGSEGLIRIDVPWLQLLAILSVASAAGALASVLPSRRAARTSPVAAIAR